MQSLLRPVIVAIANMVDIVAVGVIGINKCACNA